MKVDFIEIRLSKGLYYPSPAVTSGRSGGKLVFDCPILATEAPVLSQLLHAQTDGDFPPPSLVLECPRHLAPSISWRRSVHPNVLSSRQRRSPPGALHNSTKNCYANSFQNKCENNFARKARSVEVLNQPSNRKRDSITNHPPPSPNP